MSKQLGFCIEQNICTGCKACQVACKDKNNLDLGQNFRIVTEFEGGRYEDSNESVVQNIYSFFTSMACNHCENPSCMEACPTGAMYKRKDDGIVLINKDSCIGCGSCREACPYDSPVLNTDEKKMGKCDFCIDQIIEDKTPICVGACPVRAIHFGNIKDLRTKYGKVHSGKGLPDSKTKPSLVIVPHKNSEI